MQFQVPQFIDIEDKIIGPFTLKQFFYLLGAGIIIFIISKILNVFATIILGAPIVGIAIIMAFVKIGGQPFSVIIRNFFGFLKKPDFYVWKKPIGKEKLPEETNDIDIIKKSPDSRSKQAKIKPEAKSNLQDMGWKVEVDKQ
jgi:hypothetical protein